MPGAEKDRKFGNVKQRVGGYFWRREKVLKLIVLMAAQLSILNILNTYINIYIIYLHTKYIYTDIVYTNILNTDTKDRKSA